MTENRCIEVLKKMKHMFTETCAKIDENTALDMAVEAIKENQQYRAIRLTPTMVKDLIESCKKHEKNALENAHIVDDYQAIGTIEEFKALKEKNEPKKLKHDVCPNCSTNNDKIIKHLGNPQAHKVVFCWNCGQALET